jgi:hypothetical protein
MVAPTSPSDFFGVGTAIVIIGMAGVRYGWWSNLAPEHTTLPRHGLHELRRRYTQDRELTVGMLPIDGSRC